MFGKLFIGVLALIGTAYVASLYAFGPVLWVGALVFVAWLVFKK